MAIGSISPVPVQQFFDNNGDPLSGGKIYTYLAGTSTPLFVYADYLAQVPLSNPVILDSGGRSPEMFLSEDTYKFVLTDANDVTIWTADNVASNVVTTPVDNATLADRALTADHAIDSDNIGGQPAANIPKLDAANTFTQNINVPNLYVGDVYEKGRATPLGHWIDVPYDPANFAATDGTWTVSAVNQRVYSYMMIGRTLWVECHIQGSTVTANLREVLIKVPAGLAAARITSQVILLAFPAHELGYCIIGASGPWIQVQRLQSGFWPGSTDASVYVSIKMSI